MWSRVGIFTVIAALATGSAAASSFTLETSAFLNGGMMPKTDAASADACGGRNLTPPLHLSGFPGNTRSFAVVLFETDAGAVRGFVHCVAYGIAPATTALPPGFGSQASPAFTGGMNDAGPAIYFGPCPPHGDAPHHYVFTAYALDIAPQRLRPGLTRPAFLNASAGHTLASAQITGRFSR